LARKHGLNRTNRCWWQRKETRKRTNTHAGCIWRLSIYLYRFELAGFFAMTNALIFNGKAPVGIARRLGVEKAARKPGYNVRS